MPHAIKNRVIGLCLCISAAVTGVGGWIWFGQGDTTFTDNAYVQSDVTALAPKVGGYVISVDVEDNQAVKAGRVLFRIDDRDYRAGMAQAVANVEAAQASLATADADIDLQHSIIRQAKAGQLAAAAELTRATKDFDRLKELVRSRTVSLAKVDEGASALSKAEAGVESALAAIEAQTKRLAVLAAHREAAVAAVAQAQAARDLARINLESTIVRAPVDGVVANRKVRVGRLVAPGAPLLDLVPVNDVWIVANVKETQIGNIRPGQRARVRIDGYPNKIFDGVVDSFAPGSGSAFSLLPTDNATGNFVRVVQRVPVKVRFIGDPLVGRIVPGLSARIEIAGDGDVAFANPKNEGLLWATVLSRLGL